MSWIKSKSRSHEPLPVPVSSHMARQKAGHREPHVDPQTELLLADFLIKHGRLEPRRGRPAIHLLGTLKNEDDTIDYSVRTLVRMANGKAHRYDSHIREYPDGTRRLRLIR